MKYFKYIPALALTLSLLLSCHRERVPQSGLSGERIFVAPGRITKGLLGSSGLDASGTSVQVYDYLTGFEGSLTVGGVTTAHDGTRFKYFSDLISYPGSDAAWNFAGGPYYWTRTGTHEFFGWIADDAGRTGLNNAAFFGSGQPSFNESTLELSIPSLTFQESTAQYDFVYSQIESRVAGEDGYANVVPLSFKHLFSALSLIIRNSSTSPVTINSVSIPDLPIKGGATIDYSDGNPVIASYTTPTTDAGKTFFSNHFSGGVTIPAKVEGQSAPEYDIFTGAAVAAGGPEYRLLWPLAQSQISPTSNPPASADSLIVLDYNIGATNIPARLKFPPMSFDAGKKNLVELEFMDKRIELTFRVEDWDSEVVHRSFETESVSATQLKFKGQTCTIGSTVGGSKQVFVSNGKTIEGSFDIFTPVGGELLISATGHTGFFEITPSRFTINPSVDSEVSLKIRPVNGGDRTETSSIRLHFTVESNGREIDADSEINRDNYTIIWNLL